MYTAEEKHVCTCRETLKQENQGRTQSNME